MERRGVSNGLIRDLVRFAKPSGLAERVCQIHPSHRGRASLEASQENTGCMAGLSDEAIAQTQFVQRTAPGGNAAQVRVAIDAIRKQLLQKLDPQRARREPEAR